MPEMIHFPTCSDDALFASMDSLPELMDVRNQQKINEDFIQREKILLDKIAKYEIDVRKLHFEKQLLVTDNIRLRESKDLLAEENARLSYENNELTKINVQIEDEKRNAMSFFISQVGTLRSQILQQDKQASDLKLEIQNLEMMLEESKKHESKLSKMLIQSKEILIEGVSTLTKNVSSGISKVSSHVSVDGEFKVLEKLKEFAFNVRDEIMRALNIVPRRIAPPPMENLDAFEAEQDHAVKVASLQTYVNQDIDRNL